MIADRMKYGLNSTVNRFQIVCSMNSTNDCCKNYWPNVQLQEITRSLQVITPYLLKPFLSLHC